MFVNDNFMISIVIATYNSELTLGRAMQSVLNLTYQDWECIVVDGASKDGTLDIVKEFVDRDARFRYISEPDHGIYDAFNKGWKMATGEWVMYLGSDDEYTSDGIQTLVEHSDDADVVYGDVIFRFPKGKEKYGFGQRPDFWGTKNWCIHQSVMMKRNVIEHFAGFDESYKLFADWDLLRKVGQAGYKYHYENCPIAYFSVAGASSDFSGVFEAYRIYRKTNGTIKSCLICVKRLIRKLLVILKHKLCC